MNVLDPHSAAIASRVLDEEETVRRHVVVALSGAHAYGFPSPDSDLDLKAIHVEPTRVLAGLSPPKGHAMRLEVVEGVEIDYSSNELGPVLGGILAGNGNYIERVLGPLSLRSSPLHETLRPLVQASLSRRIFRHYNGFSDGQLRDLEKSTAATAKKALYVIRTALTGAHLLRTGALVIDMTELADDYGFSETKALVERKKAGERTVLDDEARRHWTAEAKRARALLDDALAHSVLPDEADGSELEAWLTETRRSCF